MRMRESHEVDLLGLDSCRAHIWDGSADLRSKARLTEGVIHPAAGIKKHQVLTRVHDQ
jgi:hypothetical protein